MAPAKRNAGPPERQLRITLVRSLIGRDARQRATVTALGLHRIRQVVTQQDSPVTRGMLATISHLVRVQDA